MGSPEFFSPQATCSLIDAKVLRPSPALSTDSLSQTFMQKKASEDAAIRTSFRGCLCT